MYAPDTILRLREPREPGTAAAAYNRVRVIGESPIMHSGPGNMESAWVGAAARGVLIEPIESFGANLDKPLGELQELFEVESEPVLEIPVVQPIRVVQPADRGPSPEEVFAAEAAKNPQPKEPKGKPNDPLAEASAEAATKRRAAAKKETL